MNPGSRARDHPESGRWAVVRRLLFHVENPEQFDQLGVVEVRRQVDRRDHLFLTVENDEGERVTPAEAAGNFLEDTDTDLRDLWQVAVGDLDVELVVVSGESAGDAANLQATNEGADAELLGANREVTTLSHGAGDRRDSDSPDLGHFY